MADIKHVYLTAHGGYPSGSWTGETAQIGLRFSLEPVATAPAKGDIYTPTTGGEIQPDFGSLAGTNGTLAKTWKARVGGTGSLENFNAAEQVDAAEDMWTFLNAVKSYQYSGFRWTHVKMAAVDALGKSPIVSSVYTFTAPVAGTSANGLPPQVAMALSTRANLVGRRGRGRVYLPALGSTTLSSDGTISTLNANAMRTAFKTLIDNIQNVPGFSVYSPIVFIGSSDSPTVVRPVEVRTGSRLDTIQSRRRQVVEAYTTTAL
jgi:hypothetical protein